jgi:hypothetical protein
LSMVGLESFIFGYVTMTDFEIALLKEKDLS